MHITMRKTADKCKLTHRSRAPRAGALGQRAEGGALRKGDTCVPVAKSMLMYGKTFSKNLNKEERYTIFMD